MSLSTAPHWAQRPAASYQHGHSGNTHQATTANTTGRPPTKNIVRQPLGFAADGMRKAASIGEAK